MKIIGIIEIEDSPAGCCELCGKTINIKYVVAVKHNDGGVKYYGRECIHSVINKHYDFNKSVRNYKIEKKQALVQKIGQYECIHKKRADDLRNEIEELTGKTSDHFIVDDMESL